MQAGACAHQPSLSGCWLPHQPATISQVTQQLQQQLRPSSRSRPTARAFNLFRAVDELRKKTVVDPNKTFDLEGGSLIASSIPSISQIDASEWNALVQAQEEYNPFISYVSCLYVGQVASRRMLESHCQC